MLRMTVKFTGVLLITLSLGTISPVTAADGNEGLEAYRNRNPDSNHTAAFQELQPRAEQGHAHAQYNLGKIYAKGKTKKDEVEAVKWYTKAAQQGDSRAQYALGAVYANGRGVSQDETEAIKWYAKSAGQGNAWGQYALGSAYQSGRGVQRDEAKAVTWLTKAAQQGDASAQYSLGEIYTKGIGVAQDKAEAVKWYTKAVEQDHFYARSNLSKLLSETRQAVGVATANVRDEPTTSAKIAFQLKYGDLVHSLSQDGAWHRIYLADIGRSGWMHQSTFRSSASNASPESVELFGTSLKTATRKIMRQSLTKTSVVVIREDNNYWVDTYNPASELKGADQLHTGYTSAGDLAFLQYRFPSQMDKNQTTKVAKMVSKKYDNWGAVNGSPKLGDVEYQWNRDSVIIRVFRGWPNTTTFLRYEIPENLRTMRAEIGASDEKNEESEARNQSNAF